jgi:outer membrane murein-binding lipoprotein Lpp
MQIAWRFSQGIVKKNVKSGLPTRSICRLTLRVILLNQIMGKILLIVAVVVSLLTAVVGFLNHGKVSSKAEAIAGLNSELAKVKSDLAATQGELTAAQENLAKASAEKDDFQAKATVAEKALNDSKSQISQMEEDVKEAQSKLTDLQGDLQAKDTRIAELEAAQTGAVAQQTETVDTSEFEARITEQETLIEKLQGDLTAARTQVEDLRTREQERSQQVMRQGLTGRVLAVNQGWNFVVLNLGDRNGVVNNAEMLVKRGDQMVGKIRITSVEPSSSIADIVVSSVPRGFSIQPGDSVIYTGAN